MIDIGTKKIPCIDAHTHVFPTIDGIRFRDKKHKSAKYGVTTVDGEPVQFLAPEFVDSNSPLPVYEQYMKICGIDKAVFPQSPAYGYHNDFMDQVLNSKPGVYQTTGVAYPCDGEERFMREAVEALDNRGYIALKFEMPDTPFKTDDPSNAFVFKTLMERNKYCMIDMGWHKTEWDFPIEMITNTVREYKDLTFIFPHLGISHLWDINEYEKFECLKKMLALLDYNENVWFDISGLTFITADFDSYPYPYCQKVLKTVKEMIGFDHVMWGTDYPCVTLQSSYAYSLDYVRKECDFLTVEDKENLFYKVADKVWFGIDHGDN